MKRFITLWFCMIALLYSFSSIAGAMDSLIKGSAEKTITQQINQLTSKPATTQPVSVKQVSAKKLSAKKETTPTSDFIDNNNGTVTHRTTGLTWQRCAMGQTWTDSTCSGVAKGYSYKQALALKDGFAGYSDWRVPTIEELRTIVERGNKAPAINKTLFPNTASRAFFRSSSRVPDGDYALVVNFYDGKDDYSEDDCSDYPCSEDDCGSCAFVRLVRSGQSSAASPNPANTQVSNSQLNLEKVSQYSSSAVWNSISESKAYTIFQDCRTNTNDRLNELNCDLAKMKQSGASQEAMSFVKQFTAPEESIGWLSEFKEKGRVDLGVLQFANRANTNDAYVLLNGNPSLVSTELGCTVGGGAWHQPCQSMDVDISHDQNYPQLKKQYPKLMLWPAGADFKSMQSNSDGGQRFIFGYPIMNGCHACEVVGGAEIAFDFSGDGTFKGTKLLGLVGVEAEKIANVIEPLEVTKPTEQINTTNQQFNMANSTPKVLPRTSSATFYGPTPYLSFRDSPFSGTNFSYFYLEDFEDGLLNTPGVNVTTGWIP